jgi:hypothetical protein
MTGTADWIIDLGPEGGDGGGEIVAAGTPEEVVREKRSYTGAFLKPVLARRGPAPKKEARRGGGVTFPSPACGRGRERSDAGEGLNVRAQAADD